MRGENELQPEEVSLEFEFLRFEVVDWRLQSSFPLLPGLKRQLLGTATLALCQSRCTEMQNFSLKSALSQQVNHTDTILHPVTLR